jgi:2-keto-4-pentenoate hydratase
LEAGQLVSTGTCTGLVTLKAGEKAVADFGELGAVEVQFV